MSRQLFPVVRISLKSLGVICYDRSVLIEVHKNYFNEWCVMDSQPTFFFNNFDNFESHNSLKLSFTNIRGLCSNFVDHELFIELNSPDIIAPCETNLDESIDCDNFSLRGYLP